MAERSEKETQEELQKAKAAVRSRMKTQRRTLASEEKVQLDEKILENLKFLLDNESLPAEYPIRSVYCYVSYGKEADTRRFLTALWEQQVAVAVPRVEGERMQFYRVNGMEDLTPGCMGIPEPVEGCPKAEDDRALVITPGLAFSRQGDRIGYGGGYYDRFFAEEPQHLRVGIAYPFQIMDTLPAENTDRRIQMIVSSDGIFHTRW